MICKFAREPQVAVRAAIAIPTPLLSLFLAAPKCHSSVKTRIGLHLAISTAKTHIRLHFCSMSSLCSYSNTKSPFEHPKNVNSSNSRKCNIFRFLRTLFFKECMELIETIFFIIFLQRRSIVSCSFLLLLLFLAGLL